MQKTTIDVINQKTMVNLATQIDMSAFFSAEIDDDGDLVFRGRNQYYSIPPKDIIRYELSNITISITTDYMVATIWRDVDHIHFTFFPVKHAEKPFKAYKPRRRDKTPATCTSCGKTFKNKHGLTMHKVRSDCEIKTILSQATNKENTNETEQV